MTSRIGRDPGALTSLHEGGNNEKTKSEAREALSRNGERKSPMTLFEHLDPVFHEVTPKFFSYVNQNIPGFALSGVSSTCGFKETYAYTGKEGERQTD